MEMIRPRVSSIFYILISISGLVVPTAGSAGDYECMLVQARLAQSSVRAEPGANTAFPVDEVILEGINFGANPVVYFGRDEKRATVTKVEQGGQTDAIHLKLPYGTPAGTYRLIIQNTTGPFLDDDANLNPIFCFGSVTIGFVD